jgi:hypothetical protein
MVFMLSSHPMGVGCHARWADERAQVQAAVIWDDISGVKSMQHFIEEVDITSIFCTVAEQEKEKPTL